VFKQNIISIICSDMHITSVLIYLILPNQNSPSAFKS